MFICKNPEYSRSYLSHDGLMVTNLVRDSAALLHAIFDSELPYARTEL